MRKHGAAFADNAQAAPALPDKHTRKQKECGGGSPGPARGPQPHHGVQGAGWESLATQPRDSVPSARPWVQLRSVGAPQSAAGGSRSGTFLWHSHCPCVPIPGWFEGIAWQGRDGQGRAVPACGLQPPLKPCSLTCATQARQGRTGTCPQGADPAGLQWWWNQPRAEQDKLQQHRGTLEQAEPNCKRGQAQPLGSTPSSCSHPWPPTPQDSPPHPLTGDRLSLPAAWSLPRSSPAVSGSHRGTASLSSVRKRCEGSAGMDQTPQSPLQPCWASQTCTFPYPGSSATRAPGADKPCPHHSSCTAIL